MKTLLLTLILLLTITAAWAQVPQQISYQSVIRDGNNVVVASSTVGIKISLLQGTAAGSAVYVETHSKTTNANGLVSLEIGTGTVLSGSFASIDWSNGPYLIKTETDPTGGTNYSIPGIAPLNSVPYALYSANGTPGPKGDKGDTGATGETGPTGATGPQGLRGETGSTGATGPQGERGLTGATGPAGATGAQGPIGLTGLQGAVGQTGPVGPQGVAGPAGATGPQGPIGLTGPQGPAGPTGAAGPIGLTGPAGATGPSGNDGAAGATGAQGVAGPQGPAGPTGAAGLLTSGSAAGNTPYWDGTQWVVNSSNLFNNGTNIGIGTTSPTSKLQVVGSGPSGDRNNMLRIESNNNASLTLKNTNANAGGGEYQLFTSSSNSNPALGAGSLAIYYDHPTNAAYRLSINTAGNVGIGTGMPTEKLDVAGNLKTSGTVTAGTVTYPNTHGSANQVLSTTGSGALVWTTPSSGGAGVPYTGATGAVNLGNYDLTVHGLTVGRGGGGKNSNVALGISALPSNHPDAAENTAIGYAALISQNNSSARANTAVGFQSLEYNRSGQENSALGHNALKTNTASYNTAIGSTALQSNTTGTYNTAIGYAADVSANNLTNATAIGANAVVTTSNTIQLGNTSVTDVKTSGSITAGGKVIVGTSTAASTSAVLEASSTSQGFLPPRMTNAQKNLISSPVAGLVIWCSNCGSSGELQVYNGSIWTNMVGGTAQAPILSIGDSYGGGKVAYILQASDPGYSATIQHGLIVATTDQSTSIVWWNGSHITTGATGTALGTGLANTDAIISNQGPTATNYAAGLARAYTGGGFTDWYLPSKEELGKLNLNAATLGLPGNYYWSSTEIDSFTAWIEDTGGPWSGPENKFYAKAVRAIRSF